MNQESNDKPLTTADLARASERPASMEPRTEPAGSRNGDTQPVPLFEQNNLQDFRSRWEKIQTGFVDEPRMAVEEADTLVAQVMQQIAENFSHQRSQLEEQWHRDDSFSTEDLRLALQRYRSFFNRLLSI